VGLVVSFAWSTYVNGHIPVSSCASPVNRLVPTRLEATEVVACSASFLILSVLPYKKLLQDNA
jgi:hypothetical protein